MKKLFILIIVIAALFSGYKFWELGEENVLPEENEITDNAGIPDNWKEFDSPSVNAFFRYPPEWAPVVLEDGVVVLKTSASQSVEAAPISVNVKGELPFLRALEEIREVVQNREEHEVTIANMKGVEISGVVDDEAGSGTDFVIFTMLDRAGRLVSLDYTERGNPDLEARKNYRWLVSTLVERRVE